jgi:hypothetical protein
LFDEFPEEPDSTTAISILLLDCKLWDFHAALFLRLFEGKWLVGFGLVL